MHVSVQMVKVVYVYVYIYVYANVYGFVDVFSSVNLISLMCCSRNGMERS